MTLDSRTVVESGFVDKPDPVGATVAVIEAPKLDRQVGTVDPYWFGIDVHVKPLDIQV